jgi:crotonobetainyl-CoA:carnitine CoA-transferase CaiB-like acyl-CoA transferase
VTPAEQAAFDAATGAEAEAHAAAHDAAAWVALLDAAGVPAEISDETASLRLHDNALFRALRWTVEYTDKAVGKLEQIGHTYSLSATPGVIQGSPLHVGDNTTAILGELGYSTEEIEALAAEHVIGLAA